ncbi:MAG: RNA-splicing factor [Icmadophila ericetorum]|nr:RNA-splicing factor [Icmadophila ericetorum]
MDVAIEPAQPVFKKRGLKKSNIRKRPPTPSPPASDFSDYSSSDDEGGRTTKRRRKTSGLVGGSSIVNKSKTDGLEVPKFTADRTAQIDSANDATKQSNWFDEKNADVETKSANTGPRKAGNDEVIGDGTYRGASNYQTFIQKNPNAPSKAVGPVKAPTNIRTITVTDFAPDVCKDYKQTGFCGFGDSCKFLHAREDYKQGWQLDRDWETVTKGKKLTGKTVASANRNKSAEEAEAEDSDDAMLEGIPFACIICKEPYKNPIITKCGHYFCESCALQRFRKTPSCGACGAGTSGVFNGAKSLKKLLNRKRAKAQRKREKAIENGEEVSDDDGGPVQSD